MIGSLLCGVIFSNLINYINSSKKKTSHLYIYIYNERAHLREHEVLPSSALLEDSLAIKDMDLLFSLVHQFKTILLSLTKIRTLCLLNKHQLKDNNSLFS